MSSSDAQGSSRKVFDAKTEARLVEFQQKLDEHGFAAKVPRVEYSNFTQTLFFYGKEDRSKFLCGSIQLEEFLEGNVHFSDEEETEIRSWYEVSLYKLFREGAKIESRLRDPDISKDERAALTSKHDEMKAVISEEGLKAKRMDTLGYYFGETDPVRKELLYEIHHSILQES